MSIRAVIVDDEAIARDVLAKYLKKYCPQIELIGEAENSTQGTELILDKKPQLVFLDVEMPYGNAFDVLEATQEHEFEVVFITAFSEYSLKALNLSAAYYILKPIDIKELIAAVEKVETEIENKQQFNKNKVILENLKNPKEKQQIILPTQSGFDIVKLKDIIRFQADGNFTQVHTTNESQKLICKFLKHFQDILSYPFIRIHRSHIVNINFIKSYQKGKGGFVIMQDGSEVEVSQTYKKELIDTLSA